MDGFLVLGRCLSDDIPMGLFATREEAESQASKMTPEGVNEEARRLQMPSGITPTHVSIIEFRQGKPQPCETVAELV